MAELAKEVEQPEAHAAVCIKGDHTAGRSPTNWWARIHRPQLRISPGNLDAVWAAKQAGTTSQTMGCEIPVRYRAA